MIRPSFLLALFLAFGSPAVAQLSLAEFLRSALDDPEVKTFEDQITYLNGRPYRLAPLREVQFRTQNREMLETQQEYAVRLSPANPWEVKRHNQYFREMNSALSYEKDFAFKDALTDRYYTAIEYIFLSDMLRITSEGKDQLEQQMRVLEQQSGSRYFDAEDYVDLKADQLDYLVDQEELSFDLSNQFNRISRTYPKARQQRVAWAFKDVVTPERIRRVVDSIQQSSVKSTLIAYQEQRIRVAQSQYRLEQANFNLGFLQTSYDRRRVNQDRNPFSVSLGVSIPIFNPNKGDMARRKLDIIEAEYDLKEESYQSESDKLILSDKVISLLTRLENLDAKLTELKNSNLAQTLSTIRGGDPLVLIQFNQRLNRLQELSFKVRRELLMSYIEYLAFTDVLQKTPLINYLSPSLSLIRD